MATSAPVAPPTPLLPPGLTSSPKAFEFLNHSVTMLEKESCLQQIKIQQLEGKHLPRVEGRLEAGPVQASQVRAREVAEPGFRAGVWPGLGQTRLKARLGLCLGLRQGLTQCAEVLGATIRQPGKEGHKWSMEQGQQELYGALAQGLQGLQKTLRESEEVQRARTTRCLQLLAQEIRDRWASPGGQPGGCSRKGRPGRGRGRRDGGPGRGLGKGARGAKEGMEGDRREWVRCGRLGGQKAGKTGGWRWGGEGGQGIRKPGVVWEAGGREG